MDDVVKVFTLMTEGMSIRAEANLTDHVRSIRDLLAGAARLVGTRGYVGRTPRLAVCSATSSREIRAMATTTDATTEDQVEERRRYSRSHRRWREHAQPDYAEYAALSFLVFGAVVALWLVLWLVPN